VCGNYIAQKKKEAATDAAKDKPVKGAGGNKESKNQKASGKKLKCQDGKVTEAGAAAVAEDEAITRRWKRLKKEDPDQGSGAEEKAKRRKTRQRKTRLIRTRMRRATTATRVILGVRTRVTVRAMDPRKNRALM
jgi:hypothetical protein